MDTSDVIAQMAGKAAAVAEAVDESHLGLSTPCSEYDVAGLLEHMINFARLSAHAAEKTLPEGARLTVEGDWLSDYDHWCRRAAEAWGTASALEGETSFGSGSLPAARAAAITSFEFGLHAWDLAKAIDVAFVVDDDAGKLIEHAVESVVATGREGGFFGPPVAISDGAGAFDRALALSGRDPGWVGG